MNISSGVYVAGHRGMVGAAILKQLQQKGFSNIMTRTSTELDLRNDNHVSEFFKKTKPEYVFVAAAKVGGIMANNNYPAQFLYDNLQIQNNIIHHSYLSGVKKLLFLGSSCIYPRLCPQPIKEEYILTGPLEPTNEAYAIAKIAGIRMCDYYRKEYGCNFIAAMPTNLYGPNDQYHPENSHLVAALIRKFHLAKVEGKKEVEIWGTGNPRREFMFVEDVASALVMMMEKFDGPGFLNVGVGEDQTILEFAHLVKAIVGFNGNIVTNPDKPDGTPRKLLDVSKIQALGFRPVHSLKDGLKETYRDFLENKARYLGIPVG